MCSVSVISRDSIERPRNVVVPWKSSRNLRLIFIGVIGFGFGGGLGLIGSIWVWIIIKNKDGI